MDRNALDWLFSTSPQAIAALVGLIFAGVSFILGKVDDSIQADPSLKEIGEEIKKKIHKGFKNLLWVTFICLFSDLLCLWLNPINNNIVFSLSGKFNTYILITILIMILNVLLIFIAVRYMLKIMNPNFFKEAVDSLAKDFESESNSVSIGDFITHFIDFEKTARNILKDDLRIISQQPLSIWNIIKILYKKGEIEKQDFEELITINKLRNIIMHEGAIKQVEVKYDNALKNITKKIKEKTAKSE